MLVPIGVFVAGLNIWIDPGSIVDEGRSEQHVAAILLAGSNCIVRGNFDERFFRGSLIAQSANIPDIIVFGSSRSMQIRASHFVGFSFLNYAMSMSDLEDIIALHGALLEKNRYPKYIILGLEPWFLAKTGTGKVIFRSTESISVVKTTSV